MKKINPLVYIFIGSIIGGAMYNALHTFKYEEAYAATITRGITFSATDLVTNTKLHQLVDSATISGIDTADIADSAITTLKLGANSVTTAKITPNNVTGGASGSLAVRTVASTNIAYNAVTEDELNTNIVFRAGTLNFSNNFPNLIFSTNQIASTAIAGVTNTAGVSSAGKVVKLGPDGLINTNMLPAQIFTREYISTNNTISAGATLVMTHGLGAAPKLVQCQIVCQSADNSYSANDVVILPIGGPVSGANYGISPYVDATTITVQLGNSANGISILTKGAGVYGVIDATKWKMVISGWR